MYFLPGFWKTRFFDESSRKNFDPFPAAQVPVGKEIKKRDLKKLEWYVGALKVKKEGRSSVSDSADQLLCIRRISLHLAHSLAFCAFLCFWCVSLTECKRRNACQKIVGWWNDKRQKKQKEKERILDQGGKHLSGAEGVGELTLGNMEKTQRILSTLSCIRCIKDDNQLFDFSKANRAI